MPIGRSQRGFTYLFVLFFVALTAAAMAALGQSWQNAAQRERERELEFRGGEIARAIQSYRKATPGVEQNPQSMDDLLEDRRALVARHHLRQLYPDPFTGQADWETLPDPADPRRFIGVRSRSSQRMLRERIGACTQVQVAHDCAFRAFDFAGDTPPQR
jgi:type II secretory pathway pseudopilin PulG